MKQVRKRKREKQILSINTYMWNLENGTDGPISKAAIEMQRINMWIQEGQGRVGQIGRLGLICTHYHV